MRYVFGNYTLDPQRYELRRAGEPVSLRPKVFQILAYLLAHRDRVVPKQELFEQLWSDRFVGDATLNSCIMAVRKAIGDSGQAPRYLLTVRGRGYRFMAPVEVQTHAAPDAGSQPAASPGLGSAAADPDPTSDTRNASIPPTLEPEYKLVTVLCCGLAEAPALAARLGPEAMHDLMQAVFSLARRVMQQYAGTITHVASDGFTALFGAPVAQEDHARRAVLAALELVQRLHEHATRHTQSAGDTLAVCMGVHTGPVVAGHLEHGSQRFYTAVGETTHLASRLQHLAAPGAICLSATTYRLVQAEIRVETYDRHGADETPVPLPVYRVQGIVRRRAGVPGRGTHRLSRFVGRSRELAILHECVTYVTQGQGQVVGIVGEPGSGKSRLLYEFRHSVLKRRMAYCAGRCLSYGSSTPYLPVRDLLRQSCEIADTDAPAMIITKVHRCLQEFGMASEEWAPYLLPLLGVSEGTGRLDGLDPEAVKRRTFAALRQLSLKACERYPLVIVVEDAQWLDQTSEAFFTSLVDSLAGAPILFLATYRPGYRPPWIEKSYATQIALQRLAPHDSLRLLQSIWQEVRVSDDLLQELVAKAQGNPFFLEELSQAGIEHGDVQSHPAVPDTIQGVIMARIDRLSGDLRRLLQTAAVLGREVPLKLLHDVWEGAGDLDTLLLELTRLEFLYESAGAQEPTYCFRHALIQEVAYASLLYSRRQALHAATGRVLETLYAHRLEDAVERLA